ncbi:MAG: hypothetical protein GY817_03520 [bacterium]|nr:hypothetical protein [bacterium]
MLDVGSVAGLIWDYLRDNQGEAITFKLRTALTVSNQTYFFQLVGF